MNPAKNIAKSAGPSRNEEGRKVIQDHIDDQRAILKKLWDKLN
jgi:hypothetical protein